MRIKNSSLVLNKLTILMEGDSGSDYSIAFWNQDLDRQPSSEEEFLNLFDSEKHVSFCSCPNFMIYKKECKHIKFVRENL